MKRRDFIQSGAAFGLSLAAFGCTADKKSYPADKKKGSPAMEVVLTKDNFEAEVLKADRPVLVDFWATWCGPCRMLAPIVAEVAEEKAEVLKVGKVNVDDCPELAAKYGINSIPALLYFKKGELVGETVGYMQKDDLLGFLNAH